MGAGGLMGEGGGGVGLWDDAERHLDSFFGVCCFVLNIYEYRSSVDSVTRIQE